MGLLAIALGIVTLRTGWMLPTARRHVARPQLHGLGALLTGASVVLQGLFYFRVLPSVSWEARFFTGNALLLAGLLLIALSQLLPLRQNPNHADPSDV
ncbi:hypothetical protein [Streptomyces sp. NBC_01445]|uniref:hypothetical protein n=1 Tax=Streptomyces sp. NBC_01445 TaxID=2903869 RepID=UPI002DDC4861|nr:hypothetical protein [Streptomyces sp. NBC_01445]WSE03593.1 hypothetical protein OG574_09555 [Streptomyces sp. NBC_01445]